jgi:transposase
VTKKSLSGNHLLDFIGVDEKTPVWIGLDVHKQSYHAALRRADGGCQSWVSPADPIVLAQQLSAISQRILLIVYEAGPTDYCLERVLKASGYKVAVVAPSRIPRPVTNQAKTDKLDCLKLAEYAAKKMIEAITAPSEQESAERSVLRRRNQLVDSTRKTKQRIKSFLLFHGIEEEYGLRYWNRSARSKLSKLPLQSDLNFVLKSLLRQLSYEEEELVKITNRLSRIAKRSQHGEVVKNLKTVPGVGDIAACASRTELFRPERFRRAEEFCSFPGLAPAIGQRREKRQGGWLMRSGQTRLKSLLIEAAWMWRAKDPWARKKYQIHLGRCGIAQKAITALARRLAVILWRLSLENRACVPR